MDILDTDSTDKPLIDELTEAMRRGRERKEEADRALEERIKRLEERVSRLERKQNDYR